MIGDLLVRPARETDASLYSNFDHELDAEVVAQLLADPGLYAQHGAWNFCGYVWFDGSTWREQVWQWKSPVEDLTGESVTDVISQANDRYGTD